MNKEQISYNMSRIKSKDTSIETVLRKELFKRGVRFRKNAKDIYGHPDISIKKYKIAIFCDGDFWHGYNWEERESQIKSNRDYWIPKIERNMEKDIEVNHVLSHLGYTVIRIWEHEIKKNLNGVCDMIISEIEKAKNKEALKIRKAKITDKDAVYKFYDEIVEDMQTSTITSGWKKGLYPTEDDLFFSIAHNELYILLLKDEIIGAFVMDSRETEGYDKGKWSVIADKEEVAIIHKLAISYKHQNRGLAKILVDYAIDKAKRSGKKAIRLDVYKPNRAAARLYLAKGFSYISTIELFYEDTGLAEYELYELPLK